MDRFLFVLTEMNRSNRWASYWSKSYDREGIEGLKDKPKTGRRQRMNEHIEYKIKTILKESNQGWATKQVEKMLLEKTGRY